jgi:O-antigen ligase
MKAALGLRSEILLTRLATLVFPATSRQTMLPDAAMVVALMMMPVFHLTVKNWTNGWLVALAIISVVGMVLHRANWQEYFAGWKTQVIVISLLLPLAAVVGAQLLRGQWVWNYLDGPSRFILAIVVFLWLQHRRAHVLRVLSLSLPLSVLACLVSVLAYPSPSELWFGRFATYFVDCNTLGDHIVLLGFLVFLMLQLYASHSLGLKLLQISAVLSAVYLAIGSGTRGAWIAVPILAVVWLFMMLNQPRKLVLTLAVSLGIGAGFIFMRPLALERAGSVASDAQLWYSGEQKDTSGGVRLEMWSIATRLFEHRPVSGYGDYRHFKDYLTLPSVRSSATEFAIEAIKNGPHNELLANALRSGIFGIIAFLALHFGPLGIFANGVFKTRGEGRLANAMGLSTTLSFLIFGVTLEVFSLKFSSSFYGFLIAVFAAQGIPAESRESQSRGRD